MFLQPYEWASLLLPVWAALMWLPVSRPGPTALTLTEIGFLRQSSLGALATAVTELYVNGLVRLQRRTFIRDVAPMHAGVSPLGRAVYEAMNRPVRFRMLRFRPKVRAVVSELGNRLIAEGLVPGRLRWLLARGILLALAVASIVELRSGRATLLTALLCVAVLLVVAVAGFVPRRTVAGHRLLASLRRGEKEVAVSTGRSVPVDGVTQRVVLAVALHGATLPVLTNVFALRLSVYMPWRGGGSAEDGGWQVPGGTGVHTYNFGSGSGSGSAGASSTPTPSGESFGGHSGGGSGTAPFQ